MDNRTQYVVGFLFHGDMVALIEKKRPAWQKGKLNGIGGHIEPGETPYESMRREFNEEADADIASWEHYCTVYYTDSIIHFFRAFESASIKTITDEELCWKPISNIPENTIPNLHWLIPLALYTDTDMIQVTCWP